MNDSRESAGRRETDLLASEVDTFVHTTENRLHHIFIIGLVSLAIIALTTAAALFAFGAIVRAADNRTKITVAIAKRAEIRARVSLFRTQLAKEKVCSQSANKRVACRALFERLSRSISNEQRDRLACVVLNHLKGSTAEALRNDNPRCKETH